MSLPPPFPRTCLFDASACLILGVSHIQVFVGNIPYGTTEENLMAIFSEVGRVLHIRMALNTDTGRPKGYAFIEYEDPAAALSAIRNLNNRVRRARAFLLFSRLTWHVTPPDDLMTT